MVDFDEMAVFHTHIIYSEIAVEYVLNLSSSEPAGSSLGWPL